MKTVMELKELFVDIPLPTGILHAVRDVSFTVLQGEIFCLVGESGCGKSLTALSIMNLLHKSARRQVRTLSLSGRELTRLSKRQMSDIRGNEMAMIFQEPMTALNPCYTIGNQLEESLLRHRKTSRSQARERAIYLLEKVGINAATSRLKQYPHQLSGGLRQRVMIAMALMCDPSLILADEPTTALDVTIQAQILSLLASLQNEYKMGMILITHDLGVVARVADRLAVMYCGQVIETGSTIEVFENPLHPYTRGLLSSVPIPGKTKPGEHLDSIPGIVPTPIGNMTGCSFRNRCSEARSKCSVENVKLLEIAPGRSYRCLISP